MTIHTQVEINASPEEVREVFLDFEHWHKIKSDMIRSVARLPAHPPGPVEENEKLLVDFTGTKSQVNVLENTPTQFRWRGDLLYVLSGEHTFRFELSTINAGGTTFVNDEVPMRLNFWLMKILPVEKMFQQFCVDFKTRVEEVVNAKKEVGVEA